MNRTVSTVKRAAAALLALALTLALCACGQAESAVPYSAVSRPSPLPAPDGLRIAVASDLHFNPDSRPGDEPVEAEFSSELADALLWDAQRQQASLLLLTGDLVNGGKPGRHELLAEKLRRAEAAGLSVYVLPGNHDLAPVTQTDFARVYADFGFSEAASRDACSLSYCVKRDGLMLLMMDMGGYPAGGFDLPGSPGAEAASAFLSEDTLGWAEAQLRLAREEGLTVLAAGHFNLLSELGRDPATPGYYVHNGEKFTALLREYGVRLFLSGHTHTRAVYQEDGLRELVTEYLLAYPTGYSMLDLTPGQLRYAPRRIDVDGWAEETGRSEPILLHFTAWQEEQLRRYSRENIDYMAARNPLNAREQSEAADYFYAVMDAYWQGTLYSQREALDAMPGRAAFFRCAEGYAYAWWLRELLDNAGAELAGFILTLSD